MMVTDQGSSAHGNLLTRTLKFLPADVIWLLTDQVEVDALSLWQPFGPPLLKSVDQKTLSDDDKRLIYKWKVWPLTIYTISNNSCYFSELWNFFLVKAMSLPLKPAQLNPYFLEVWGI